MSPVGWTWGFETVKAQWFAENQCGEAPDSGADH